MLQRVNAPRFRPLNRADNTVFRPNRLSLGLADKVLPDFAD